MALRVESITARPLTVPLRDPFVIASGRIDATRAALVEATVRDDITGAVATGLGEAAALPPVTREDQPELLAIVRAFAAAHREDTGDDDPLRWVARCVSAAPLAESAVARAAVECALLDAVARLRGEALYAMLSGGDAATRLVSDITIPIHAPTYMATLAGQWRARGFRCFKVKVGLDLAQDLAALGAIVAEVPDATFVLDANGGFSAREAVELYEGARRLGAVVVCFEQPCARDDLDGMRAVTAALPVPVIADESVRSTRELREVVERGAAGGVNLKLVKMGGLVAALEVGREAKRLGMRVMFGAMVETRLGITAAAHVCAALGGVDFVDLDTAWLMASDRFEGGYAAEGPVMTLPDAPGLGLRFTG